MSKDPAVLFYTADFLIGCTLFSMEQRGQYITLLCDQHQLGHLPENHMISICKSKDNPVFGKFQKDTDGLYFNERMDIEHKRRVNFCNSRSNNKSGRPKIDKTNKIIRKSYENHMETENETDNEDINIDKDRIENCIQNVSNLDTQVRLGKTSIDKNKITPDKEPLTAFQIAFRDFTEMRLKIRKPLTEKAKELIKKKLKELSPDEKTQIEILNQSIMNCWQGVFELKNNTTEKDTSTRQRETKPTPQHILDLVNKKRGKDV